MITAASNCGKGQVITPRITAPCPPDASSRVNRCTCSAVVKTGMAASGDCFEPGAGCPLAWYRSGVPQNHRTTDAVAHRPAVYAFHFMHDLVSEPNDNMGPFAGKGLNPAVH